MNFFPGIFTLVLREEWILDRIIISERASQRLASRRCIAGSTDAISVADALSTSGNGYHNGS